MADICDKTVIDHSFGFDPKESTHHFLVHIPRGGSANIEISEHFTWDPETGSSERTYGTRLDGQIRVILKRRKWDAIADEIRAQFNQRIKKSGIKIGSWKVGDNLLRRELGKELVLLAWAIEDADPSKKNGSDDPATTPATGNGFDEEAYNAKLMAGFAKRGLPVDESP